MKDQPLQPPIPDTKDKNVLPNQDTREQTTTIQDQEWQDTPIDENESGIWEQTTIEDQEWRDAFIDENESGIWEQTTIQDQEWRDAFIDENESGIWEQTTIQDQEWQEAAVEEDESGIWEQTAIAKSEWTEVPVEDDDDKRQVGMIYLPKIVESLYYPLIPLIGYGFLGLSVFDYINIIIPVKIAEPAWIIETIGQISERIPILWIGLLLVFFRREGYVRRWEVAILKSLSWLCLFLGIMYLLITPMLIGNTVRMYRLIDTQIEARSSQQTERIKKAREQVSRTKEEDISTYLQSQNRQPNPSKTLTPKQFKESLLQQADKSLSELEASNQVLKTNQLGDLIKKTTKWSLGNLLSTFVCIWIWYLTRWTRIKNLELDSKL